MSYLCIGRLDKQELYYLAADNTMILESILELILEYWDLRVLLKGKGWKYLSREKRRVLSTEKGSRSTDFNSDGKYSRYLHPPLPNSL